ncbi:2-amino-4-hydroxy-6-hydroxymethyldihydropteridine diphosphokinase [bacterium]|nr:MAG: 2-amino-4-hydroxy-6-hydroxymethyldihydropteridine diphosphokinase [bacterium]
MRSSTAGVRKTGEIACGERHRRTARRPRLGAARRRSRREGSRAAVRRRLAVGGRSLRRRTQRRACGYHGLRRAPPRGGGVDPDSLLRLARASGWGDRGIGVARRARAARARLDRQATATRRRHAGGDAGANALSEALRRVALGFGANLDDAPGAIHTAIERMRVIGALTGRSDLYRSRPWGVTGQPEFYNAAALYESALTPRELLAACKRVEQELGRVRSYHWGPRAIDVDILAIEGVTVEEPELHVPHARLRERAFALVPLLEIAPSLNDPRDNASVAALATALPPGERASVTRLERSRGMLGALRTNYEEAAADYDRLRPLTADEVLLAEAVEAACGVRTGWPASLLDVGCGTGRYALWFAARGSAVTGLDGSPAMLARARAKAPEMHWLEGRLPAGIPKQHFGAAYSLFVIHHLSAGERRETFARLRDVLDGPLVIATFSHRYFCEHPFAGIFPGFLDVELSRFPALPALRGELLDAGFARVTMQRVRTRKEQDGARLLERVEGKFLSTFHVMAPEDFAAGLDSLRAWLQDRRYVLDFDVSVVVADPVPGRAEETVEAEPADAE